MMVPEKRYMSIFLVIIGISAIARELKLYQKAHHG